MSDSVRPHRWQPTRLPCPSPGKNTGVGCHFLLQCMKVKIESEVAQSCLTLRNPMDCSLPGSSIHGIFQAKVLEWGDIAFSDSNHSCFKFPVSVISTLLLCWFWCFSVSSDCVFVLLWLVVFFLISRHDVSYKRNCFKWWGGVGGGDTFYSPMIKSQSSGEPMALHYEPQKYFSVYFSASLRWGSMARVGQSWVFPFSQMEF